MVPRAVMWAQIAKTTQVNASKTQLRHGHSDGSQYPPTSLVLNEHHFVSFSVAIVDASTSQLLLVESDVESGDLYLLEGELESHHASISEAALQACRQQVSYAPKLTHDIACMLFALIVLIALVALFTLLRMISVLIDCVMSVSQAHAEVRIDGVLCVQSYVRSLKNTYLRFLVLASASAQSIIESSSQRWVPLSCIASQPLRSSDFVPYLAWHLETGLVSSINLAQPCQPTPLVVCVSAAAASPSSSVYIRVVVAHRTRGQVLVVGPFPEASSSSNRALDSAYSASATWLLPLTHQDVRGGDTPSFAAQRLMMAAWALQVNVVGLMAVRPRVVDFESHHDTGYSSGGFLFCWLPAHSARTHQPGSPELTPERGSSLFC